MSWVLQRVQHKCMHFIRRLSVFQLNSFTHPESARRRPIPSHFHHVHGVAPPFSPLTMFVHTKCVALAKFAQSLGLCECACAGFLGVIIFVLFRFRLESVEWANGNTAHHSIVYAPNKMCTTIEFECARVQCTHHSWQVMPYWHFRHYVSCLLFIYLFDLYFFPLVFFWAFVKARETKPTRK